MRAANRQAIEAEARALGPEEVQRQADRRLISAIFCGRSAEDVNSLELAELFLGLDGEFEGDIAAAAARQYEWKTGDGLTAVSAQARMDDEDDAHELALERDYFQRGGT